MFEFLRKHTKIEIPLSPYQQLKDRISAIQIEQAIRLFSPNIGEIILRSPTRNIQEYTSYLKKIRKSLYILDGFNSEILKDQTFFVTLPNWFVGKNECYLDYKHELEEFKKASVDLLNRLDEVQKTDPQTTITIRLTPLINQISEIVQQILFCFETKTIEKPLSAIKEKGSY